MLKIYLARHGQNEDNANGILNGHRDLPLTELGKEQAHEAAEKIKELGLSFDHVFTSPLIRAQQTAQAIVDNIGGPKPLIMPGLIERDFGDMSGISQDRIRELCSPDIIDTGKMVYFLKPKNGEAFPNALERAHKVLAKINQQFSDGSILLVGHMDISYMLYAAYYKLDWKEVLKTFYFGNSELILLSPDSPPGQSHVFTIDQFNT